MSMFDDLRAAGSARRITEEMLYAEALREIEAGIRRDGIWAKALVHAEMNQDKAKAIYIQLRVKSMQDEIALIIQGEKEEMREKLSTKPDAPKILVEPVDPDRVSDRMGNFGFGFLLAGIFVNLALYSITSFLSLPLYGKDSWLWTYLFFSFATGFYWMKYRP